MTNCTFFKDILYKKGTENDNSLEKSLVNAQLQIINFGTYGSLCDTITIISFSV
jgi:hypothetical protein